MKIQGVLSPGMLKSSSSVYAICICLVFGVLCSALILASFYFNNLEKSSRESIELTNGCVEGLKYGIYSTSDLREFTRIDDLSVNGITVTVKKSLWGCYTVVTALSQRSGKTVKKSCLVGNNLDTTANFFYRSNSPLYLGGDARIEGTMSIGDGGLRRATNAELAFSGEKLFSGVQLKWEERYVDTYDLMLKSLIRQVSGNFNPSDSLIEFAGSVFSESKSNGFDKNTILYVSNDSLVLKKCTLSGNIIIYSKQRITIKEGCRFEGVLLVSPSIFVQSSPSGHAQFIGTDVIYVGSGNILEYPTALINIEVGNGNISSTFIDSACVVSGQALLLTKPGIQSSSSFGIESSGLFKGFVYSNGKCEVRGEVQGNLYCKSLITRNSSYYENFLVGGKIRPLANAKLFAAPCADKGNNVNIVSWLKE